jgi:hypothetical protein
MQAWSRSKRSRSIACALLLIAALGLAGAWIWSQRATLHPDKVRIGMKTEKVRLSWKTFAYNSQGHFGNKTQFESRNADKLGGSYSLHCRDGKVYAVEVNYPAAADKSKVLEIVGGITGVPTQKCDEHDDKELLIKNCKNPSEYYYFNQGKIGVQLDLVNGDSKRVTRIYCWEA